MLFLGLFLVISWLAGIYLLSGKNLSESNSAARQIPSLSLIIPARNEEQNLKQLFTSLQKQNYQPFEIIVVNDASTDETAKVARSFGATVISTPALPSQWTGKNWACHQGALAARGDILFFLDADCFFLANGFQRILSQFLELNASQKAALSILPWHDIQKNYENFSLFFNLIMAAGTGSFKVGPTHCLVGQSLLVYKEDYFLSGGHEAVKDQVLENFFMSQFFKKKGIAPYTYSGQETLSLRMFPNGIKQVIEGWSKAFAKGAKHTQPLTLAASILWLFGFATAVTQMFIPQMWQNPWSITFLFLSYAAFATQLYVLGRKFGSFKVWPSALYPVTWLFYQYVFARSLFLKSNQKTWKGRKL